MTLSPLFRAPGLGGLLLLTGLVLAPGSAALATERLLGAETSGLAISINAEHLIELYQSTPGLTIIDARHYEDHRLGHIEQSLNLPLEKIDCGRLSELVGSRDQPMVFYCNRGSTSSADAVEIASACGYRRLFWLEGGFIEWKDKDYPFVLE